MQFQVSWKKGYANSMQVKHTILRLFVQNNPKVQYRFKRSSGYAILYTVPVVNKKIGNCIYINNSNFLIVDHIIMSASKHEF